MSRPDVALRNSGPRIVTARERYQRSLDTSDELRCWSCGSVNQLENPVNRFELRLHGRSAGWWQACDGCFGYRNEPPLADPLDVTQTA